MNALEIAGMIVGCTVLWATCSITAYRITRHTRRREVAGTWTTGDRMRAISFALLTGPVALLVSLALWWEDAGYRNGRGEGPASW